MADDVVEDPPYTRLELKGRKTAPGRIQGKPHSKRMLINLNARRALALKTLVHLRDVLTKRYEDGMDATAIEEEYDLQKIIYEELCRDTQQVPDPFPGVEEIAEEVSTR